MTLASRFSAFCLSSLLLSGGVGDWFTRLWPGSDEAAETHEPTKEEKQLQTALDQWWSARHTHRVYVQLDKPLYQPGETVHARAFSLETKSLALDAPAQITLQLQDPKGAIIATQSGKPSGDFALDEGAPGGQYTLIASGPGGQERRTFSVSQYETPRFKKSLTLKRKAYGPGDEVTATAELRTATDAPLSRKDVNATLSVDGAEQHQRFTTDGNGKVELRFQLPANIDRGDAQLSVRIDDAGISETVSARVPVVLKKIQLSFFPEGGDLVRGLPSRVYFSAADPLGKPADVEGRIIDDHDVTVATFRSIHDGLGRFSFHPATGREYHAELTRPSGIVEHFNLPAIAETGCVLSVPDETRPSAPLSVSIGCTDARDVIVGAFVRESPIATRALKASEGSMKKVTLPLPPLSGVARVTLFSNELEPLAERLVFRDAAGALRIAIRPDRAHYSPKDPVTLDVDTRDASGKPVSAELALAVVDDTVLSLANDKSAHLRSHVLLEREMQDALDEPDFYLSSDETAPAALDALLATRGWRRFAWQPVLHPPPPFQRRHAWGMPIPMGGGRAMPAPPPEAPAALAAVPMAAPGKAAKMKAADDFGALAGETKGAAADREFAHKAPRPPPAETRSDFRQSVYWNPRIHTDAEGHARIQFTLSEAVTSFRATAEGVGNGLLGSGDSVISATLPFFVDVKVPLEVAAGDRIDLPVTLRNGQIEPLDVKLDAELGAGVKLLENSAPGQLALAGNEGRSVSFPLEVTGHDKTKLSFLAQASGLHDGITRELRIVPIGFPRSESISGTLDGSKTYVLHLKGALPDSISAKLTFYPSPVATMVSGLQSIIREPVGCFEQASSSNYPNVMVSSYLQEHGDSSQLEQYKPMLERGYRKVSSYETPTQGYEWFGGSPGHEALTAYGLLEFADMRRVYNAVDPSMISRTAQWLLSQRDGRGGFSRNARALDSFGAASPEVTNAYIVYALCEAGSCGVIRRELDAVSAHAMTSEDAYVVALATAASLDADARSPRSQELLNRLLSLRQEDGHFHGTTHSITRSGGKSLDVETTSIALMALAKAGRVGEVQTAAQWLSSQRDGAGGFGSTQATVLALKALMVTDKLSAVTPSAGEIAVDINGRRFRSVRFEAGRRDPVVLDGLGSALHAGDAEITLTLTSERPMPFSLAADYWTADPASSPDAPVRIETHASTGKVAMGGIVHVDATIDNATAQGQPMTLARVGIPGGATFLLWQLKELVEKHEIDFFETRPREVILYFRALAPRAHKKIGIDLIAAVPGQYTAPASSAYLYYTAEKKAWASPLALRITRQ